MTQSGTKSASAPVLLIEDEPAVMALVRAVLEGHGYTVVPTESGADALRLLESGDFHGVISDMRTPGGVDGAQVHAWIATHRPELASRLKRGLWFLVLLVRVPWCACREARNPDG